jgi:hypothetical protein
MVILVAVLVSVANSNDAPAVDRSRPATQVQGSADSIDHAVSRSGAPTNGSADAIDHGTSGSATHANRPARAF